MGLVSLRKDKKKLIMDVRFSVLCLVFLASSTYCAKLSCAEIANLAPNIPGTYVPQCKEDGSYTAMQCHFSTGHCWCVDEKSGREHYGTKRGPSEGKPNCSPCEQPLSTSSATGMSCLAYFERFYFDKLSGECKQFIYGGCFGNANNFDTKEECEKACVYVPQ